jgi:hypothetical protein
MATELHQKHHQKLQISVEVNISTSAIETSIAAIRGLERSGLIVC